MQKSAKVCLARATVSWCRAKVFPRRANFAAPALEQLLAKPVSPSFPSGRARKIHGAVPQIGEQIRGKSGCEFLFCEGVNASIALFIKEFKFYPVKLHFLEK